MLRAPDNSPPSAPPHGAPAGRTYRYLIVLGVSLFTLLALISYDDRDTAFLAGGLGDTGLIRNWMGYLGAYTARLLLVAIGFPAFLLCALGIASAGRRFAGGLELRRAGWDYWCAFALTVLGACMLFGTWPDMLGDMAPRFNIAMTTGGALGQRLCDPDVGWMQIVLNPAGNAGVSLVLIAVGLAVMYLFDWHGVVRFIFTMPKRQRDATSGGGVKTSTGDGFELGSDADTEPRRQPKPRIPKPKPEPAANEEAPEQNLKPPKPSGEKNPAKLLPAASPGDAESSPHEYELPSLDLLNKHDDRETAVEESEVIEKKQTLQTTLNSFGIDGQVGEATCGPRVTLFEILPAPGVKVERISQIANNIAMELRAVSLRVLAPIPGRNTVGIEVPNAKSAPVSLRGLMGTPAWRNTQAIIPLLLGRSISGGVVLVDLTKAPHLLIAGATGSGKSVCINALIVSMLCRYSPDELRLIMIDPKVVEFRMYEPLPHLIVPVISDIKRVPLALGWVIREMQRRYKVLAKVAARNLEGFNSRPPAPTPILDDEGKPIPPRLPYIVVIIDELADIMMTAKADVETSLARIAQLSRAVGIHAIIATQRPSVNVITGTIKANFPTRIAFQVTSQIDSRTILDGKGAEALLGRGDMLFKPPGASKLERNQSAFVEDDEIERVVKHWAAQGEQHFEQDVFKPAAGADAGVAPGEEMTEADEELIQKAVEVIVRDRRPTTSYVQRCLRIGYNRAALIMEILEQRGVIGPQVGTAPREILVEAPEGATPREPLPEEPETDEENKERDAL